MSESQNHLNHATWECKYHVVFTPKYTSIPQVGEKWLAVVAASDSCRGHDSRWLS